ncbi:MAG: hypothetical protein U0V70_14715 [Terriglobia bacterium]
MSVLFMILLLVLACLYWLWPTELRNAEWHRKVESKTVAAFIDQQEVYNELVNDFRNIFHSSQPCGLPTPGEGTVTFRRITFTDDGLYSFADAHNSFDRVSAQSAAKMLNATLMELQNLGTQLRKINRSVIFQHDAEIGILAGDNTTYGVLFVPTECPQFETYKDIEYPGLSSSFLQLKKIGKGWFYFVDRR